MLIFCLKILETAGTVRLAGWGGGILPQTLLPWIVCPKSLPESPDPGGGAGEKPWQWFDSYGRLCSRRIARRKHEIRDRRKAIMLELKAEYMIFTEPKTQSTQHGRSAKTVTDLVMNFAG